MRQQTALIVLVGIFTFFFSGLAHAQVAEKNKTPIKLTVKDTINPLTIPVDSLEALGNLKFKLYKSKVHASYYHNKFNGKRTASGKKFDNNKYTAAHRKFPFGTKLRITNETNGKCVIVEVTDRGPFSKGREIDLSKRAFMEIAHNKNSGAVNVTIEIVDR
jgi:rare lipoprotein A